MNLQTASEFKQYFHTLTPEMIADEVASKKIKKGMNFKLATDSEGPKHVGGASFEVVYSVNEGTAEEPNWVVFYKSGQHQKTFTPAMIKAIYEWAMVTFPDFAQWAIEGYGGMFEIELESEPVQESEAESAPEA